MTTHHQGHLALKDIAELADVSRPAVSNWKSRYSTFPDPVEDSPARRPLFEFSEVLAWLRLEDLLPKDWEANAIRLIIPSAINPLAVTTSDTAAAALISLAVLAVRKHDGGTPGEEWATITSATSVDDVHPALTQLLTQLDHDLLPSSDISHLLDSLHSVPPSALSTLVSGLSQVSKDNYGAAAHVIIDTFFSSGGRSTYGYYATTSSTASSLIANAAGTTTSTGDTIFDPTCGIAGTLISLSDLTEDVTLVGNDINRTAVAIASLYTYLVGLPATFTYADILTNDPQPELRAQTIVSEPPLGIRLEPQTARTVTASLQASLGVTVPGAIAADAAFLTYPIHHLAPEGRAYVLTNLSLCSHDRLAQFRQNLVARGAVEAVIQLPRRILTHTSVATALWVLRAPNPANATEPVLLADASNAQNPEEHIAQWLQAMRTGQETTIPTGSATLAEMITQDNTLLPSQLLRSTPDTEQVLANYDQSWGQLTDTALAVRNVLPEQTTPADQLPTASAVTSLAELGSITRITSSYRKDDEEPTEEAISAQLIPLRDQVKPTKEVSIKADSPTVHRGDLLIPQHAEVPARVFDATEGTWVAPAGMFVLRVTGTDFHPEYLAACVNASLNTAEDGGMTPRRKLSQIHIPLLSVDEQQKVLTVISQLQQLAEHAQRLHQQAETASDATMHVIRYGADI